MARVRSLHQEGRGTGQYPGYHALWHLFEIGVLTDLDSFDSQAWTDAEDRLAAPQEDGVKPRRSRVALIDTSVSPHPNLDDALATDLAVDFFANRLGTFDAPHGDRLTALIDAASPIGDSHAVRLLTELKAHLRQEHADARDGSRIAQRIFPATAAAFSSHGTAMAGLIGARPVAAENISLAGTHLNRLPNGQIPECEEILAGRDLSYIGVDPTCEIVPISTNFDPEPEQLILALLYAHIIDADLIVLARDFPDPWRSTITGRRTPDGEALVEEVEALRAAFQVELSEDELELWESLNQLVIEMSLTRPIVCASGNGGDDTVMYPGCLAEDSNGIVLVGAHNSNGARSAFSTTRTDAAEITLYAPSGDSERLDAALVRLDRISGNFEPGFHSPSYLEGQDDFSAQDVISTDVPGAAGYNGSAFPEILPSEDHIPDYRSYYCRFSGTSAAAAITAGALSLAYSTGRIPRGNGVEAKRILRGTDDPGDDARAEPKLRWSRITP